MPLKDTLNKLTPRRQKSPGERSIMKLKFWQMKADYKALDGNMLASARSSLERTDQMIDEFVAEQQERKQPPKIVEGKATVKK